MDFNMQGVLYAVLVIAVSALVLGLILAIFSKLMAVPVDQKLSALREAMPGANCGACGHTSCDGYSEVLADGTETKINLCKPGGQDTIDQISKILGVSGGTAQATTAMVLCQGNHNNTQKRAKYHGIQTCHMAELIDGGDAACGYGCLGYGDCEKVCQYDAIHVINGVSVVDPSKCTSCMMCIETCPKNIIELVSMEKPHSVVFCHNEDIAQVANKVCSVSCISCGRCVKACPVNCIEIVNNRAIIDYDCCINCGECQRVCPHDCILSLYPPNQLDERVIASTTAPSV